MQHVIVVSGATGAQGGSVARFLLEDPDKTFAVRALTRNPDSQKAKALAAKGAEIVRADLDNEESLKTAMAGAYGVFGVTFFWETEFSEVELRQGKKLVDAAKAAGVRHFVWSALERTSDPVVSHWNSKADIDDYLKQSGIPRTSLFTAFYYENALMFPFMMFQLQGGEIVADWPSLLTDGPIGGYSVADTGAYVLEAFKHPEDWIGNDMRIQADVFTPRQYAEAFRKATGKNVILKETDRKRFDESRSGSEELWTNLEWFYKHDGNAPYRDLELTKRILPARKDMSSFIAANKDAILASLGA